MHLTHKLVMCNYVYLSLASCAFKHCDVHRSHYFQGK